jgi:hypothetical protein
VGEVDSVQRWVGRPDETELAIGLPARFDGATTDVSVDEADVMRIAGAWSVDPTALDGQPATADLTLVRLPTRQRRPVREPRLVNITDLIESNTPYEQAVQELAKRLRRARPDD